MSIYYVFENFLSNVTPQKTGHRKRHYSIVLYTKFQLLYVFSDCLSIRKL